ncbi:hypothetical protein FRC03_011816 [Tulasnella sp. 419]|nr:hypothetical protein FRC03_011816 [Tulasnella sp. 419]
MADVKRKFDDDDVDLKDIDADIGSDEDSDSDVPDENMEIPQGSPSLWLVKVPKSLMEKWMTVDQGGVPLGVMRVAKSQPSSKDTHKIRISLPENPQFDTTGESKEYIFNMPQTPVLNQFAFGDKVKRLEDGQPAPKKARSTQLMGKIAHKGSMIPVMDATYETKIRTRGREANKPRRNAILLDHKLAGGGHTAGGVALPDSEDTLKLGKANLKMLASGASRSTAGFDLSKRAPGKKPEFERFARISRDELLDRLFGLFQQKPMWSLKDLRATTEQPEAYLKEILNTIAYSPKSGPNTHMWILNSHFVTSKTEEGSVAGPSGVKPEVKAEEPSSQATDAMKVDEDDDDDDDDDNDDGDEDEDEEFEEV